MGRSRFPQSNHVKFKAFTLVELTLIVGVIGVLATITISYLNPLEMQKRARDSVRLRDVNTLKSTILLAIQSGSSFSGRCVSSGPCDSLSSTQMSDGTGFVDIDLSSYLTQLPADPLNSSSNFVDAGGQTVSAAYEFAEQNGDFEIRVHLESKDNLIRYSDDGGNDPGYYEVGTKLSIL